MKTQNILSLAFIIVLTAAAFLGCDNMENITPAGNGAIIEEPGVSASEFDAFAGEVGILINVRDVARKGYKPTEAVVKVGAENGDFSQTIALDPSSFMGQIRIPVADLSDAAKKELSDGVPVSVTLQDKDGNAIITDKSLGSVSFLPNPHPQNINTTDLAETQEAGTIHLSEGTNYYLQIVKQDGTPLNQSLRWNQATGYGDVMTVTTNNTFAGDQPDHVLNFIPVPGKRNTFYIRIAATGELLYNSAVTNTVGTVPKIFNGPKNSHKTNINLFLVNQRPLAQFIIEKVKDGVYVLKNNDNKPVETATGYGLAYDFPNAKPVYWRIVSRDISWTVQSIGTDIVSPVLPAAQTGFSFNSTLKNCGNGTLEQTVGADFSEQRLNTIGWEESISINNSSTQSISATVGVEFDAKFFGFGATYSASVTGSLEWSQTVTSENSNYASETVTKQENYFSSRTITVPSGSASLVYDAYQFYENVRVDYVQRLRLSGIDEEGTPLTGNQIMSLFQFTRFNGVVNTIEDQSVVFTLRGHSVLDKFIETQSNVQDVPANCK
jgi:hypothetical protein